MAESQNVSKGTTHDVVQVLAATETTNAESAENHSETAHVVHKDIGMHTHTEALQDRVTQRRLKAASHTRPDRGTTQVVL